MKRVPSKTSALINPMEELFLDDSWLWPTRRNEVLKTDIEEKEKEYLMTVEIPGFKKDDIDIVLENGYLSITATRQTHEEKTDDKGKIIRKERSTGVLSRNFYIGDYVKEDDITAKYEDGELKIVVPKISEKETSTQKVIEIK